MDKLSKIQKIIKEEMEKRGFSMMGLCNAAGLKPTYIKDIMSGKSTTPDTGKLMILANFLNRPLSDFIENSNIYIPHSAEVSIDEQLLKDCADIILQESEKLGKRPGMYKTIKLAIELYKIAEEDKKAGNNVISIGAAKRLITEEGKLND